MDFFYMRLIHVYTYNSKDKSYDNWSFIAELLTRTCCLQLTTCLAFHDMKTQSFLVRSDSLLHGNLPRQQSVGLLIALEYLSSFVWKTPNLEVFHILWFLKCTMHIIKQEAMNIYTETKTWTIIKSHKKTELYKVILKHTYKLFWKSKNIMQHMS